MTAAKWPVSFKSCRIVMLLIKQGESDVNRRKGVQLAAKRKTINNPVAANMELQVRSRK